MLTAFARTLILYFLIMLGLRLMGKRQIADLEPSELVLTMMVSDSRCSPGSSPSARCWPCPCCSASCPCSASGSGS